MTNRLDFKRMTAAAGIFGVLSGMLALGACTEEEPPPPVRKPQVRKTQPSPQYTPVDQLMMEMQVDSRIMLDERYAPKNDAQRRAVLNFFDGFASVDSVRVGQMLHPIDKEQLSIMQQNGEWEKTLDGVEMIQVRTGSGTGGRLAVLGLFYVEEQATPQPTLWLLDNAQGDPTFEAVPNPPDVLDRISGDDLITQWHALLQAESDMAYAPDEELVRDQIILDEDARDEERGSGPESPGGPRQPGGPGPGAPNPGNPGSPGGPSPGGAPI